MRLRERASVLRCAFCHGGGELAWVCKCGAVMHADCQVELKGGCTTFGCAHVLPNPFYGSLYRRAYVLEVDQEQVRLDAHFATRDRYRDAAFWYLLVLGAFGVLYVVGGFFYLMM